MAKEVLKTLTKRIKMAHEESMQGERDKFTYYGQPGYELFSLTGKFLKQRLCTEELHQLFGKTICPVGKTATVKITIEVEGIE